MPAALNRPESLATPAPAGLFLGAAGQTICYHVHDGSYCDIGGVHELPSRQTGSVGRSGNHRPADAAAQPTDTGALGRASMRPGSPWSGRWSIWATLTRRYTASKNASEIGMGEREWCPLGKGKCAPPEPRNSAGFGKPPSIPVYQVCVPGATSVVWRGPTRQHALVRGNDCFTG